MRSPKPKKVVLDIETTYGEDPTSPKPYVLSVKENNIIANQNTKSDDVIGGDIDSGGQLYNANVEVSGSIKAPMRFEDIGVYLKAIMGDAESVPASESGFHTHTFKSNKCIPSLVVEDTLSLACEKGNDFIKRFNGIRANTMAVNVSPEGDYNIDISFVGAKARDSIYDSITPLDASNEVIFHTQNRIKNEYVKVFVDNDTDFYKVAKDFNFTIDRGTSAEETITTGAIVDDSKFELKGSLSSIFDPLFYQKAKQNKEMTTKLVFENGNNKLEFIMEQTQYAFKDEGRKYGEKYPLNCSFNAFKTTADAKLTVILTNNVESY